MWASDTGISTLRDSPPRHGRPQNRYSSSKWQQLKQSIAAKAHSSAGNQTHDGSTGSATVWHLAVQNGSNDQASSARATSNAEGSIQQEVSDILRRAACDDGVSYHYEREAGALGIRLDGTIVSSNYYQDQMDSRSAEADSCGQLPGFTSIDAHLADANNGVQTTAAQHGLRPVKCKSPSKQVLLHQLKQQRQQLQPRRQAQGAVSPSACIPPIGQQWQASTSRPTSAPFNLRDSHNSMGPLPTRSPGRHLSTSYAGKCASLGNRSSSCWQPTGPRCGTQTADAATGGFFTVLADSPSAHTSTSGPASSRPTSSRSELDRVLLGELQQELASQLQRMLLRRWQQTTADVLLEKARARPMNKLLSKRKVVRAWRVATQQRLGDQPDCRRQDCNQETHASAMQVQSQQMPGDMSIGGLTAAGEAVQQPLSEPEQRLLDMSARREAVAMQFYFLYRLHGCWCSWWQQAAAGTLQRLREEQDRTLAEQHARVLQQQHEQQQKQHQCQIMQQKQHRLGVAANFNRLYLLHKVMASWHQQASVSAALSKLFPDTGMAAVARDGKAARHSLCFPAGMASCELQTAAVIQHKAQQLLQRLAGKQALHHHQQQKQNDGGAAIQLEQQIRQQPDQLDQLPLLPQQQQQLASRLQQADEPCRCGLPSDAAAVGPADGRPLLNAVDAEPANKCTDVVSLQPMTGGMYVEGGNTGHPPAAPSVAPSEQHAPSSVPASLDHVDLSRATMQDGRDNKAAGASAHVHMMPTDETAHYEQQQLGLSVDEAELVEQSDVTAQLRSQHHQHPRRMATPAAAHAEGQPLLTPQQHMHQQAHDMQQLQQQLHRVLAAEQRQQREQQRLEQQLQAELDAQQSALAELHYNLVLVSRLGLVPWRSLKQLRRQQEVTAGTWRRTGLLKAAILVWKLMLVHRHSRHVCSHIRAFGQLRQLQQQRLKVNGLYALAAWAQTSRQYKQWLIRRVIAAWKLEQETSQHLHTAAQQMRHERVKRRIVQAWLQYVEQQAQEQLMLELELDAAAQAWRLRWWQLHTLKAWHTEASNAVQERQLEVKRQETWGRVRSWLSEFDASRTSTSSCSAQGISHGSNLRGGVAAVVVCASQSAGPHKELPGDGWCTVSDDCDDVVLLGDESSAWG